MKMSLFNKRIVIALILIFIIFLFYYFGFAQYFTLAQLKGHSLYLKKLVGRHYGVSAMSFIGIYSFIIALGIPAVAPLTLLGGFLFGILCGALYAIIGATVGSIIAFLAVRYFFRDMIQHRYNEQLDFVNKQVQKYGARYLLLLQYASVIPFFVINSLAALSVISLWTFIWTTIVGFVPMAFAYSFAGCQLAQLESVRDIISPWFLFVLFLFVVLALVLPIVIRRFKGLFE